LGAAHFLVKSEGMFLAIFFTHYKVLKELNEKVDRASWLTEKR